MLNNDSHNQNNNTTYDPSTHGGKHQTGSQHNLGGIRDGSDPRTPNKVKKQRNKTTAIALGILMMLSIGLIGFEVVNKDVPKVTTTREAQGTKSLQILAMEKDMESPGLISPSTNQEFGESEALKEANRIQTNKIKTLQRQLAETNHKLHETKTHLFTKGDASERSRLAALCQDLVEKERINDELRDKLTELETQKEISLQKVKRMEQTVDALASMTDTQRETKEQVILSFQEQIEKLQTDAHNMQLEMEKTTEELVSAQQNLKDSLSEKINVILNLENQIGRQNEQLEKKEKENRTQAQLYTTSEKNINTQLQNLIAAMELELLRNGNMLADMEVIHATSNAHQEYSKLLEKQIQDHKENSSAQIEMHKNAHLALTQEYMDVHGLLNVYSNAHNTASHKHDKLSALLKDEKNRADKLHKDLQNSLAKVDSEQQRGLCIEQELHKTAQTAAKLSDELQAHHNQLESKKQEMDILVFSHASLKDQLQERINQLTSQLEEEQDKVAERDTALRDLAVNLELEKTHTMELDHRLRETNETVEDQVARSLALEDQLSEKAEKIAAMEDSLKETRNEINKLKTQNSTLTANFEGEKIRTQELHRALVRSLEESEGDQVVINKFKEALDESTETVALLQDRMRDKKDSIDQLEDRLAALTMELDEQKQQNIQMQQQIADMSAEKNAVHNRANSLEARLSDHSSKLVSLEDGLADKQHQVRGLLSNVEKLSTDLELEKQRSQDLENELNNAISRHESEYYKSKTLEQNVEDNEKHLANLVDQISDLTSKYNAEKTRSVELEKNLMSVISKLDEKEKKYEEQIKVLLKDAKSQKTVSSLQKEVELIRQERDVLAQKHDQQVKLLLQQQNLMLKLSNDTRQEKPVKDVSMNTKTDDFRNADNDSPELENGDDETSQPVPTPVNDETEENEPVVSPKTITHQVSQGESLSSISVYYYGTPNRWIDIYEANRDVLNSPKDNLLAGVSLYIPQ